MATNLTDAEIAALIAEAKPLPDDYRSRIQTLLKVSDVTFLSRERVRSTFMEDFRSFMDATLDNDGSAH